MIAPASIPPTVAEGIVNYKLIKVLCEAGYKVDLISRIHKNKVYPVDYISIDENLCKIHYIPSETKITLATIWQHICAYMKFGITYRGAHWAYLALRKALALLDDNIYECVLTKSLPSELVGIYLKKYRGLRWIPTWNDPYPEQKISMALWERSKCTYAHTFKNVNSIYGQICRCSYFPFVASKGLYDEIFSRVKKGGNYSYSSYCRSCSNSSL